MLARRVLLLVSLAIASPAAAAADEAELIYEPAGVSQVDLTISPQSLQALRDDPRTYVPAGFRLTAGDQEFAPENVQVKLKGHGAFRPVDLKAAFKVKFAKTDRLLGLKGLTLNNMVQDPSMVHEALGYEVLRAAGLPAPRTGFAYVRVNRTGYGLYLNLETYDSVSLARLFATTQHLYEADVTGVDLAPGGAGGYEVDEGDEDDRADLEALIDATHATAGDWSDAMAGIADLGEMTRLWAGEQYLGHWDGYSATAGPFAPNNYYLHSDATGRFAMLASGLDQTFVRRFAFPGNPDGLLAQRCLADASCLEDFRANLGAVAAAADGIGIGARLDALAATVARWRPCPSLEQADDSAWQSAVTATRAFIRDRRAAVTTYTGAAAPATDPALDSARPPRLSVVGCPVTIPRPTPASEPGEAPPIAVPAAPATAAAGAILAASVQRLFPQRLTARVTRGSRPYRFTASGSLLPPAEVGRRAACEGRVAVRVMAGARTVSRRRAFLREDCKFAVSVSLSKASRAVGRGKLRVQIRFKGNRVLLPCSAPPLTLFVRRS